jgi:predicted RNA-binding Zn-ribbon protein involved in translation (DUF1610 family)
MPEFYDRRDGSSGDLPDKFKCPSCGGFIPNNESPGAYPGAISRKDNQTEICSNCGTMEALASHYGAPESPTINNPLLNYQKQENAKDFGAFGWDNPTHYLNSNEREPNPYDNNIYDEHTNTYECPNCGLDGMSRKESIRHNCEPGEGTAK